MPPRPSSPKHEPLLEDFLCYVDYIKTTPDRTRVSLSRLLGGTDTGPRNWVEVAFPPVNVLHLPDEIKGIS